MAEIVGIKETTEMLDLVVDLVSVIAEAKKNNGKIDIADLPLLFKLIPDLSPAFDGIGLIGKEFKDLSVEEAAALVAHVVARLNVTEEVAKEKLEASFGWLVATYKLVKAFV